MKKFLTEYPKEDGMYAGEIFAETWEEAQKIADANNREEKVVGSTKTHSKGRSVELPAYLQNPDQRKQ